MSTTGFFIPAAASVADLFVKTNLKLVKVAIRQARTSEILGYTFFMVVQSVSRIWAS